MKKILTAGLALSLLAACASHTQEYDAMGVFEATEVLVSSQGNGEILALDLYEGQELQAGALLGYIDTTQLHLQRQRLLAGQSGLSYRTQPLDTQLSALRAQIDGQRRELRRFEGLLSEGAATQKQVDDLRSHIRVLEGQLRAESDARGRSNSSVGSEVVGVAAQIAQVSDQIAKCYIHAPSSGTVLAKYAEVGELSAVGRPLYRLAYLKEMYLRAYVTADQLASIKIGQSVGVYADSGKEERKEYRGTISWIADKAEFTPKTIQTKDERANLVYAIKVRIANDGLIKRGMYGELKLD